MKYILPILTLCFLGFNCSRQSANDDKVDLLLKQATAADSLQDLPTAIDYYSKVLEIDSNNLMALTNRGRALIWAGETDKGLADYDKVISLYPHDGLYVKRAMVHTKLNHFDKAMADLKKSLDLNPNSGMAYYALGLLYETKNDLDSALYFCDRADSVGYLPDYSFDIRFTVFRKRGDYESALKELDKALARDSLNPGFYNDRGLIKNKLEQYDDAIADFNTAIKLNSRMAYAYNNKASSLLKLKQPDKALVLVNESLEIDERNAYAWKTRAEIFLALKSPDKACTDLKQAEKLADDQELLAAVKLLTTQACKN